MERTVNREFKNSVFIDMFGQDKYRLQLFQTLHPEMPEVTAEDIQTITLKQVITNHQYNDLAFLVKDRLMVFVEAQSTWSPNILIRVLLYLADTIQEYLHTHELDIHSSRKLLLPKPEFYVIYTGTEAVSEYISLRQDFFADETSAIDLKARVITAETPDIIGQYILFCRVLDMQVKQKGPTKEAAEAAIAVCQDRGVLREYLEDRKKEVVGIMVMLFDQEYAVNQYGKAQRNEGKLEGLREGRAEGRQEGRQEGMIEVLKNLVNSGNLTVNKAAEQLSMSASEFQRLLK